MKLQFKKQLKKPRIGEAKRLNFYITQEVLDKINELKDRAKALKIRPTFTCSYVLREGARLFVKAKNAEMDKIERAEFHAKKRKPI